MPRDLLVEVRKRKPTEPLMDVYGHGANTALGELVERMKLGTTASPDARVENVHLHDTDGNHIGFKFYLVSGEPVRMGSARIEIEGGSEEPEPA